MKFDPFEVEYEDVTPPAPKQWPPPKEEWPEEEPLAKRLKTRPEYHKAMDRFRSK